MIAELASGFNSLKAAKDIIQALNGIQTAVQINDVKIALQGHILDAQQALFAAQQEQALSGATIAALQSEIAAMKNWEAEKARYQLEDTGQGSVAYHRRADAQPSEPDHWICPNCYGVGKKSMLKHETLPVGRAETLVCHACGFDLVTRGVRHIQR
jgi:hypothetical protein